MMRIRISTMKLIDIWEKEGNKVSQQIIRNTKMRKTIILLIKTKEKDLMKTEFFRVI